MLVERPQVRVTEIGEYIRHHSCERRFKLEFNNREASRDVPFASRFFNPIDPVLQEAGKRREDEWETTLQDADFTDLTQYSARPTDDDRSTPWPTFVNRVQDLSLGESAYGREINIEADLGAFRVTGRIDFGLILWEGDQPRLRIVECKASRRDRTYHRIQVTLYRMLIRQFMQATSITIGNTTLDPENIECVVARIDESTNEIQAILELEPLGNLEREEADISRLLADSGPLIRISQSDLANLDYQLDMKCDGCVFNVHCFPESGIGRRLELLSIEPSLIRVLRNADIRTIDDLANLDLTGAQASQIREDPTFTASLDVLCQKARARRRTLPGGDADPDSYEVEAFPRRVQGQLPEHEMNGHRLIRVYLSVDYDYVENRLVALSAHVTKSSNQIHTGFIQTDDGSWQPNPIIKEVREIGRDANNRPIEVPLTGRTETCPISSLWSGQYDEDTGAERNLIQDFFHRLVDAIAEVAEVEEAPIHFYVWSRVEITRLVEACSRVDSRLLSHLRELLGCRESLDQLIYSCLQNEVNQRYGLGWTGRGLVVITSLRWFGRTYHWRRRVAGSEVNLDNVFTQDIFDFKTDLDLRADGSWAHNEAERVTRHKFEIRSRFFDSLTVPYWRAYWREGLPNPDEPGLDTRVRAAIRRYQASARPRYLSAYLEARVHALRWIEERIRFKNQDIVKLLMNISELPDFNLGVENTAQAAIDFLRLDQHVKVTDWIVNHLVPPADRVPLGRTIPVRDVVLQSSNVVTAMIDVEGYDIDLDSLNVRSDITEGSFVRLNPCFDNSHRGQTFGQLIRGGMTCIVNSINWDIGQITLDVIFNPHSTRYTLQSQTGALPFARATIDENVSDFVAGRVEERLSSNRGTHVYEWFDPENPQIPEQSVISEQDQNLYRRLLNRIKLPSGYGLAPDQVNAALDGLNAQIQLLQGPPGTGKTMTTAVALLLRILARRRKGDIILVAANTHTALDNLLQRIAEIMDNFQANARILGLSMPPISLTKVHSSQIDTISEGRILNFSSNRCISVVNQERRNAVLVVGGTTGALLKMADKLLSSRPFTRDYPNGLQTPMLIIDEASMIVFPHFLSLATLLTPNGEIMLAGDHRQIDDVLNKLYEKNFNLTPAKDIRDVKVTDIPSHDILCAGFPCQPFSKAGSQKGFACPKWGDSFDYILQMLNYHTPHYLILENVPNLEKHDNGRTWLKMKTDIQKAGYNVRAKCLSPHQFGIPQIRKRMFIVGSLSELSDNFLPSPPPEAYPSISSVLDKNPPHAKQLSEKVQKCLGAWQEFLNRFPKDIQLPSFPIWSMEFGATYPFEQTTPYAWGIDKLRAHKGSHGQPLKDLPADEVMQALPSYARTEQNRFPKWKIKFIQQNREFYQTHKSCIDEWMPRILEFPSSLQKFEWNCKGEERNIWNFVIQFRASGVRVKRPTTAPSLVAMTTTQVPIIGWERRYMIPRECARLQSMYELEYLPDSPTRTFKALGNAVNVDIVEMIAKALIPSNQTCT